jgi:rhodanese-related sulfurtransferase
MKKKFSVAALVALACLFAGTSASADGDGKDATATIEVKAANDYVAGNEDVVVLDVRTLLEYQASHITGAINVNVQDESFEELATALDPQKTYIVHCTKNPADGRSARALETLKTLGFKNLYSLEGGYVAWKEAELPMTEESN